MDSGSGGDALRRALFIVAHPDDAELSAGGTIALLTDKGVDVTVLTLTTSESTPQALEKRRKAAEAAGLILGHSILWAEDGRYNQVEDLPEYALVSIVDKFVTRVQPDLVFAHCVEDSHVDHVRVARAVIASSRRWKACLYAFGPAEYRTPQALRFKPTLFVDVSAYESKKKEAIDTFNYAGQGFRPLSWQACARQGKYYGAIAGCEFAEAFEVLRQHGLPTRLIGRSVDGAELFSVDDPTGDQ